MQFQVPQFIDIEDKIFGPLTFKQFIYVVGGAGGAFIIYKLVPNFYLALLLITPVVGFALALAFYKINDRPFILMLESAFWYLLANKLYLWQKKEKKQVATDKNTIEGVVGVYNPKLMSGKLKDISWSLDVHENISKNGK
jgi:hypothetical protein